MMILSLRSAVYSEYLAEELPLKNFTWNVTSYENYTMDIKLDFANPEAISSDSNDFDILRIDFINTTLIYDFVG